MLTAKQSAPAVTIQANVALATTTRNRRACHDEFESLSPSGPIRAAFADTGQDAIEADGRAKPPFRQPFRPNRPGAISLRASSCAGRRALRRLPGVRRS